MILETLSHFPYYYIILIKTLTCWLVLLNSSDVSVKYHLVAYDMMVELTFDSKFSLVFLNSSDVSVKYHLVAYDMMVELTFDSKFSR